MKKLVLLSLAVLSSSSLFADHFGRAGCGLGSLVFKEDTGVQQVLASTTNGTSYSQWFGISSGTSNCTPESQSSMALVPFIRVNQTALENDIAKGGGESLSSLNDLMGCAPSDLLGKTLQGNFENIFAPGRNPEDLSKAILDSASMNQDLKASCQIFG